MSLARTGNGGVRLAGPLGLSLLGHALVLGVVVALHPSAPPAQPPMYRVNIVAAPPGPRREGIVTPAAPPTPPPPAPTPPPPRASTTPKAMPMPTKTPPRAVKPPATPTVPQPAAKPTAPPATAGGGPTGGRGTDVATVRTEGVEFPYPGYLQNIVRQIAIRFEAPRNTAVTAVVSFIIRRDGSVTAIQLVQRSGNYEFDLNAQGAVEQAGSVKAFGPLPDGFPDDALPVIFSFDPRVLH